MSGLTRRALRREEKPRRRSATSRLLLGASGVAGAVVLGIVAGGGTFAVWNSTASAASAATVKAGSSSISVTALQLSATDLYPGRGVYAASTVRNTGTTPLTLSLDSVTGPKVATPFTSALVLSVGTAASAADCTAGRVSNAVTAPLTRIVRADLATTIGVGGNALLCVGLALPTDAPSAAAGASASAVTVTISGTQARR
ncbi:hypothetical protein [Microbacterium sp. P05]|uniref:hypothetical protein n=1 Tax=Microbacterium sp. P05 TaxID=3366948 RepID=UPI0037476339